MSDQGTIVQEWLKKALNDLKCAEVLLHSGESYVYDHVCFHCQQCIEKLLKATLIQTGHRPAKTHDLVELGELLIEHCPTCLLSLDQLRELTLYAVEVRYPGYTMKQEDAEDTFETCTSLSQILIEHIKNFQTNSKEE